MDETSLDILASWLVELDRDLRIVSITEPMAGLQHAPFLNELPLGVALPDAIGAGLSTRYLTALLKSGGEVKSFRYTIGHGFLGQRNFSLCTVPMLDSGGRLKGHRCTIVDLTVALDALAVRDRAEAELGAIVDACPNYLTVKDLDGRFIRVNAAARKLLATWSDEPLGRTGHDILPAELADEAMRTDCAILEAERAHEFEERVLLRDGMHTFLTVKFPIFDRDGCIIGLGATGIDISERKRLEAELNHFANYDDLSDLPNRRLAHQRLADAVLVAQHTGSRVALVLADIHNFKAINNTLGLAAGDQLLVEAAWRLKSCVTPSDTIARLSGDEFCIIVPIPEGSRDIAALVRRVQHVFDTAFLLDGQEVFTGVNIGSALYPDDADGAEQLLRCADLALHMAKETDTPHKGFSPTIRTTIHRRAQIASCLRKAIAQNEFSLVYQPIVSMPSRRPVAAEALIRWRSPELGWVDPGQFIPIAEETGLILPIGVWTLERACSAAAMWNKVTEEPFAVAVNVSPKQILAPNFAALVRETLAKTELQPELLKIEITESSLVADVETCHQTIEALRAQGVVLALDDFGTGYSALSYLKQFKFDILKLDQSFVCSAAPGTTAAALASSIVAMAHCLGMRTVGEGVETELHVDLLQSSGCDLMQGYLFSAPVSGEALLEMVAQSGFKAVA